MIGRLKGTVDDIGEGWVLVDVNGVGYLVEASARMLAALPGRGEPVDIAIETFVREDQIRLFGFMNMAERDWFRLLLNVQGVGARVALAIQSILSGDELAQAIAAQDKDMIARAAGVGTKLAQRIVQELKDKVPDIVVAKTRDMEGAGDAAANNAMRDALSALTHLGYGRTQAHAAVMAAINRAEATEAAEGKREGGEKGKGAGEATGEAGKNNAIGTETLIRLALQELAR